MALTREQMLQGMYRRDTSLNGRYIVAVTSTKIYCLPDCPARKPKADNVIFFLQEQDAEAAGFRPCKRCRPQHYYRGIDPERSTIEEMVRRVQNDPAAFPTTTSIAKAAGFGTTKLNALMNEHFHIAVGGLLQRARIDRAKMLLAGGEVTPTEAGLAVGYRSAASFYKQFVSQVRTTPAAYAALTGQARFTIALPAGYDPTGFASLLGRSDAFTHQRYQAGKGFRIFDLDGQPFVCRFHLKPQTVLCVLESPRPIPPQAPLVAHEGMLHLLGMRAHRPTASTLKRHPWRRLIAPRPQLRPSLFPQAHEALLWAIIGQQINVAFATRLLIRLVELAGSPLDQGMVGFPRPDQVAQLDPADLRTRQFSRTKAETLINTCQEIAAGRLPLNQLHQMSAETASQQLMSLKGIGPWTAQYTLMRGLGLADCLPLGDTGLRSGLMTFFDLDAPPSNEEAEKLAALFRPFRTLATHHLWNSHQPRQQRKAQS